MSIVMDMEKQIEKIEQQLSCLDSKSPQNEKLRSELIQLIAKIQKDTYDNLEPNDKVYLARHPLRPNAQYYINDLFSNFVEMRGDRLYGDDSSILGGVGLFEGIPVTIIAQMKGTTLDENIKRNFGMPHPEGFRKAQRLATQAEKFGRPIITFIDTPGAYPGIGAEERGQAEAIAQCLMKFMELTVPVIAIIIGEGGSGGALALSIADFIVMFEHSIYSILSPEGFASILWKDSSRAKEAAKIMKLTAQDLQQFGIIDAIIKEPIGGLHLCTGNVLAQLREVLSRELRSLIYKEKILLLQHRYEKFRAIESV